MPAHAPRSTWILLLATVQLGAVALAFPGCGSHAAEDRNALAEDSKQGADDRKTEDGTARKGTRNLMDRGASASGGGAAKGTGTGACTMPLALVTELEAGEVRTVLSGEIDAECASGLIPLISLSSDQRIALPPMECVVADAGSNAMRCLAVRDAVVVDDSRVVVPVVVAPGTLASEVAASVSFHTEDEAGAALRGGGTADGAMGNGPGLSNAARAMGPIKLQ